MSHALEFRKGGILIHHEWVYDEEQGEGEYVEVDVTNNWIHKRDLPCKLGPGVTVNDVFLFINREPEICSIIFVNGFAKELCDEWSSVLNQNRPVRAPDHYNSDDIEYLELYWHPELHKWEDVETIDGTDHADCHGVGYELREDKYESWCSGPAWNKGSRINWAIDFSPLITLIDLPIILNEKFELSDNWQNYKDDLHNVPKLLSCSKHFSFDQIIGGLIWELSFFGGENEKLAKKAELDEITDELKLTINDKGIIMNNEHGE